MLKTITPIDNSIYVEREYASSNEIDISLNFAKKSFQQWRETTLSKRKKIVTLFVDNFLKNNLEIEEQNYKLLKTVKSFFWLAMLKLEKSTTPRRQTELARFVKHIHFHLRTTYI